MATGSKDDLWFTEWLTRRLDALDCLLTEEEAAEIERSGGKVARIPVAERPQP